MGQASIRPLVASLALAALLAGCSSAPSPGPVAAAEPTWITMDPVVLAEGTFRWHETSTSPLSALEYYDLASQAVAHACVWEGPSGEEVYFNNLHLPTGPQSRGLGPWSGNLTVALDWTDDDWIGTTLRVAYQAPGLEGWHTTQAIERGSEVTLAIRVPDAGDGDEGAENETGGAADWSVWVCLGEDTGAGPPEPFVGDVDAKVVFAPDPVLEEELLAGDGEAGRTARGGQVPTQPAL